jgi:hypothetical protein
VFFHRWISLKLQFEIIENNESFVSNQPKDIRSKCDLQHLVAQLSHENLKSIRFEGQNDIPDFCFNNIQIFVSTILYSTLPQKADKTKISRSKNLMLYIKGRYYNNDSNVQIDICNRIEYQIHTWMKHMEMNETLH